MKIYEVLCLISLSASVSVIRPTLAAETPLVVERPASFIEKYTYTSNPFNSGGAFTMFSRSEKPEWIESKTDGSTQQRFVESGRDDKWIKLFDASRGVNVNLPVASQWSWWSTDGGKSWNKMYQVQKVDPNEPTAREAAIRCANDIARFFVGHVDFLAKRGQSADLETAKKGLGTARSMLNILGQDGKEDESLAAKCQSHIQTMADMADGKKYCLTGNIIDAKFAIVKGGLNMNQNLLMPNDKLLSEPATMLLQKVLSEKYRCSP